MKRAHKLKTSGQRVFVDSTSACDAENHCITFMMASCAAGAVHLAIILKKGILQQFLKLNNISIIY